MPRADIVDIYSLSQNPNFAKAKDAGIKGIIHKASQYVVDNQYEHRREAALAEGLLWGAYHFTTAASWEEQVNLFCSVVKPDPDTFPWIDHESYRGYTMPLQSAINFMDAIDQKFGRPCGMYSGNVIKEQMIRATDAQRQFLEASIHFGSLSTTLLRKWLTTITTPCHGWARHSCGSLQAMGTALVRILSLAWATASTFHSLLQTMKMIFLT